MNLETIDHLETLVPSAARARTRTPAARLVLPGPLRRAAAVGADVLALAGVVLCVPLVVLGIGIPIALVVQLMLWVGRLL